MFPKSFRQSGSRSSSSSNVGSVESMDEYLLSLNLWRKVVARDDSSLFRIVSEQMFLTQAYHEHVKMTCLKYIDEHRSELLASGSGSMEMRALSFIYRRDFIVFQGAGRPPMDVTNNGFKHKICLCITNGGNYDEVFQRSYLESAAIVQSILYELLYEQVFGVEQPVSSSQEMINSKPSVALNTKPSVSASNAEKLAVELNGKLSRFGAAAPDANRDLMQKSAPFPYRVAKSLSPFILRNVEYEVWTDSKKNDGLDNQSGSALDLLFLPGDKCQVTLDGHEDHVFNAYIQELKSDGETAVIFVEELGERKQVALNKLIALPRVISLDNSWKRRGKKKNGDFSRSSPPNDRQPNGRVLHNSNFPRDVIEFVKFQDGPKTALTKFKPPRSATVGFTGGRRSRINSAGHPIKSNYVDSILPCHGSQRNAGGSYGNRKDVKNNQKMWTYANRHRYNSEPGDGTVNDGLPDDSINHSSSRDLDGNELPQSSSGIQHYWDTGDYASSNQCGDLNDHGDVFFPSAEGDNCMTMHMNGAGCHQPHSGEVAELDSVAESAVQVMYHHHPQQIGIEMASGNTAPINPHRVMSTSSGMFTAFPYYNVFIPMVDNFQGPINTSVSASVDLNGVDLPVHDCATMRFFFNLGVQYYRISTYLQQQQHHPHIPPAAPVPSVAPYLPYPVNGATGLCVNAPVTTPVVTADMMVRDDGGAYATACLTGMTSPNGGFYPAPPAQQYVHYFPTQPMQFQQIAMG